MTSWLRKVVLSTVLFAAASATAVSAQVYVEEFDGPSATAMLGGVLELGFKDSWSARITNGAFELENLSANNHIRHYAIERVLYPNSTTPQPTLDASIEAKVEVTGDDSAGAGVMARFDPNSKDYMLFVVGPKQTFRLVEKRRGIARVATAKVSTAINQTGFNRVAVRTVGDSLVFTVNGQELLRIPPDGMTGRLVGVAAVGRGKSVIDQVRIGPVGTELPQAQ